MTSFTDCYHNILYTSARAERGREGTTSPRPRGQDAVENDGCEGSTRTLCDRSQPASRKLGRGVPGVWDLAADGISVAEEISGRRGGGIVRAQPSSPAGAGTHGVGGGGADCGVAAAASGLGSAQTASAAAAARAGDAGGDDSPSAVTERSGARTRSASASAATVRAGGAESAVANGFQKSERMESGDWTAVGAGRLQSLRVAVAGDLDGARGSGAGATGRRVSKLRHAGGDVDGPRDSVVERAGAAGLDAAHGVADEVGGRAALQRGTTTRRRKARWSGSMARWSRHAGGADFRLRNCIRPGWMSFARSTTRCVRTRRWG